MLIRNIETGEEAQHTEFFPQTSFPSSGPSPEWLTVNGFEEVLPPSPEVYVPTYQDLRRMEYPPMQDYIDGIVKNDTDQVKTHIDACLAVKAKYPKPE